MAERGIDNSDATLRTSVVSKVVQTAGHAERRKPERRWGKG